ncbi:MAG TPA: mannonate dehydratase [Bryobacteraceae bacterium]|nr:mannonate dehydratase [Bryobacteraceae bacterium]
MLRRRDFAKTAVSGVVATRGGEVALAAAPQPKRNTLMHVGADYHSVAGGPGADVTGRANLEYNLRCGVKHLTAQLRKVSSEGAWDADELKRMKDNCDKVGFIFEAIRMDSEYIMLRPGLERDRRLDTIAANIQKASQVGVKVITHHWTLIPIRRNAKVPGRGGASYEAFQLEENWKDLPVGKAGRVSSADYWERITHFLQKVIPVCKEYDVKMAAHPYDPPGLPFGYQGAENWDSPSILEAFKRYASIVDSPYNGFQLCLGTTAEGLKNPSTDVLPIVRYLGERGRIHQIHMRNIRGGLNNFAEVYPDEGEMDFLKVMRILRDVQFAGSICPDHMPTHPEDPGKLQAFAFGYGYIKALIHAVNSEV